MYTFLAFKTAQKICYCKIKVVKAKLESSSFRDKFTNIFFFHFHFKKLFYYKAEEIIFSMYDYIK